MTHEAKNAISVIALVLIVLFLLIDKNLSYTDAINKDERTVSQKPKTEAVANCESKAIDDFAKSHILCIANNVEERSQQGCSIGVWNAMQMKIAVCNGREPNDF